VVRVQLPVAHGDLLVSPPVLATASWAPLVVLT
jgi:hypothetical protein